jgi:erythromycin esterase-like protein
MRRGLRYHAILSVGLFFLLPRLGNSAFAATGDDEVLIAATQNLCHRQIAMLGESSTHEDGHTHAFKVALVKQLVNECGFDSVFFEASHYEFINLDRRMRAGEPVTAGEISEAVGGLWEFNQEFQPLVPFLLAKAKAGQLFLGGLDDQLGQLGQDYANEQMVAELTNLLPQQQRQGCSSALHRRIYNDYSEATPYSESDRSQIETCLAEVQRTVVRDKTTDRVGRKERQEMISAVQRWISRDFSSDAAYMVNRDRSMIQNLKWLLRQQPKRHKVIIWAATVHIAKQADPTWADHTGSNFGSFVHQKYGAQATSLGFSALTGSYRQGSRDVRDIPAAPPDSVEAQALRGKDSNAAFVGPEQLNAIGSVPGAFFRHSYQTLPWAIFLDDVVVFREEHPPSSSRAK